MTNRRQGAFALLSTLTAVAALTTGCSLFVDLPADCEPSDCAGYQCNAEGTECLFQCRTDAQCDSGYVCNVFSGLGSCVPTGCGFEGTWVPLLSGVERSANVGVASNGQTVGVAYVNAVGLYLQLMDPAGVPIGSPALLEDASMMPAEPAVAWSPTGWAVTWDAITEVNTKNRETLRFAMLTTDGTVTTAARSLWVNKVAGDRNEKSVDSADVRFDNVNQIFAITWSTKVATGSDVFLVLVNSDGSPATGGSEIDHDSDVFRVSNTALASVEPFVGVAQRDGATFYDVVFREGDALLMRSLDASGTATGDLDLSRAGAAARVTHHGYATLGTGAAVAFSLDGDPTGIFRAQLDASGALLGGDRFEVGEGAPEPDDASVGSLGTGEYAVVFIAQNGDHRAMFFVQYKDSGAVVGFPRRLTGDETVAPSQPQLIPTDLGYIALYQENDGPNAGQVMSALIACEPPQGSE